MAREKVTAKVEFRRQVCGGLSHLITELTIVNYKTQIVKDCRRMKKHFASAGVYRKPNDIVTYKITFEQIKKS